MPVRMNGPVADEFDLGAAEVTEQLGARRRRRRRSGPAPWVAGAAVLVVVGALTASPVPLVFGLGDGPDVGISDLDLTTAPETAWTVQAAWPRVSQVVDGVAVLVSEGQTPYVVGVDDTSGSEVWRYVGDPYGCTFEQRILCMSRPGSGAAEILVIDPRSGERVEIERPGTFAALAIDDGGRVVVEDSRTGEGQDIVRELDDGTEVWRTVNVDVVDPLSTPPTWLGVDGGVINVGWSGLALDAGTGEAVSTPQTYPLGEGIAVEYRTDGTQSVVTADGETIRLDIGESLPMATDDLGGPVQITTDETTVIARIRADQTELWRFEQRACWTPVRLEGIVVIGCWGADGSSMEVTALEEVSGDLLWSTNARTRPLLASPDAVVVVDDDAALTALDLRSGRSLWSVPLPGSAPSFWSTGDRVGDGLLLVTDTIVTRLRWS